MNRSFSIYLDIVRFLAASLVFLFHVENLFHIKLAIAHYGHEAVIIFFVLSGFVIAHVTAGKERDLKSFTVARMARIYSVAVPTLLLTPLFDWIGHSVEPAPYDGFLVVDLPGVRLLSGLLFTSELWNVSIQIFSNAPYWSLNYEVWYYAGFALLTYLEKSRGRLLFLLLCLALGPKIVLLMPIWWVGVFIYRSRILSAIRPAGGWALLAASVLGFAAYEAFNLDDFGLAASRFLVESGFPVELTYSKHFLSDWILTLFVAAHFVGARAVLSAGPNLFRSIEKPVRFLAGTTFTLYLLHQPVLLCSAAIFHTEAPTAGDVLLAAVPAFLLTVGLGAVIESRKGVWKRWMTAAWDWTEARVRRVLPAWSMRRE